MLPREEVKQEQELKRQYEAEATSAVEKLTPGDWMVLLDVDDTLAMSNKHKGKHDGGYYYHQSLVAALKQVGLTEVYLFTNYKLSSVSKTAKSEEEGNPSRFKLKGYLAEQGIQVKGVLTPLDIVYNQGIGTYYEQVILPFEAHVSREESLEDSQNESYSKARGKEKELIDKASQWSINLGDKGLLFEYMKAQQAFVGAKGCLFFDDQPEYLRQIEQVNKGEVPLFTFRVRPQDTQETYQQALEPFLKYTLCWQALKKRILNSDKVKATPLVSLKLLRALEAILPITPLPLAFLVKLDSIELQFKTFDKNPCMTSPSSHCFSSEALEKVVRKLATEKETGYQLWGYADTPLFLSPETAPKLLSKDNSTGDSEVSCIEVGKEKLFFKRPHNNVLQPLIEAFIFELNQCLGGDCVAPTRLLVLQQPNQKPLLLQASLGVGEVALEPLLMIPDTLQVLEKALGGKEALLKALPGFLDGSYFKEWFTKQKPRPKCSLALQKAYFLKIFKDWQDRWPTDFKERYQRYLEKAGTTEEGALNQALESKPVTSWLKVLALIETYPKLLGEALTTLSSWPDVFEAMAKVYAKSSAKAILQHAPKLLDCFSKRNYSQHFLLSLLTGPSDDKGENFQVAIFRDEQGLPKELQLIAIDVNMAFRQGFIKGRPQVRTVVYALRHLLAQPLETSVQALLNQTSPSSVLFKVFSKILFLEKYYKQLLERAHPEAVIHPETFKLDLSLEDFFVKNFVGKWQGLVFKLFQAFDSTPTHAELLFEHEPGLDHYYQGLAEELNSDPQAIIRALFSPDPRYDVTQLSPSKAKKQPQLFASVDSPNSLSLSVDTFTALFACYREQFIDWLKYLSSQTHISLSVGKKSTISLTDYDFWPWTKVLAVQDPWLIEGLLAFGFEVNSRRKEGGYTPLQEAVCLNLSQALLPLIEGGADTNVLFEGKSLLFLALETQYESLLVETLVALAIPYQAEDSDPGLKCATAFALQKKFDYQAALLLNNPDLAWDFSLQAISQEQAPKENPIILRGLSERRYLKPAIYQQISKTGVLRRDNEYGRHRVSSIPIPLSRGQLGIHFKEKPEFIGREIQVQCLAQMLFPGVSITPQVTVLKFSEYKALSSQNRLERGYPVLASATVLGGLTVQDVLDDPQELEKIDAVSFSQVLLFSLLINPEDGRGDNYLLYPRYHKNSYQYKLVPIDHERSFVRPLELKPDGSSVLGPKGLNVKTVLYCLDQMRESLAAKVVETFLEHPPFETLQNWLKILGEKQQEINLLFSDERATLKQAKVDLQMVFKPSVLAEIYEKFKLIQHVLRKDPFCSGMDLFCQVIPALGYRYRDAFTLKTPQARFDSLTEGCFAVSRLRRSVTLPSGRIQTRTVSKTTSSRRDILQMTTAAHEKEKGSAKEEPATPDKALKYLKGIHTESSKLKEIQEAVCQGNFERFLKLPLSDQQTIINGGGRLEPFDFSLMKNAKGEIDIGRQEQLLAELGKLPFKALRIYGCSALTEGFLINSLENLLRGSRETLSALELNDCSKLNISVALRTIHLYCPRLEILSLLNLPSSERIELQSKCFEFLRVLKLENCLGVIECYLDAPLLEKIQLINLNLRRITTQSQSLHKLELKSCKQFPEKALYELGTTLSKLKKVKLIDCSRELLPNALYYQKYPALLSLFLKEADEAVLNKIFANLDQALQKKSLTAEQLNQTKAFAQALRLVFVPLLKTGLQAQVFLDSCLGSSHKAEQLFAVQLWASSQFKLLSAIAPDLRTKYLVNNLLKLAQDKTLEKREEALELLAEVISQPVSRLVKEESRAIWENVWEALKDKDWRIRTAAGKALEQWMAQGFSSLLKWEQRVIWKELGKALKDEDSDLREAVAKALGQGMMQGISSLSKRGRQAIWADLGRALIAEDWRIRASTVKILGQWVAQGFSSLAEAEQEDICNALREALKDKDWRVRAAAGTALGQWMTQGLSRLLKWKQRAIWKELENALKDEYSWVREAAGKVLGRWKAQRLLKLSKKEQWPIWKSLGEALEDESSEVRAAATQIVEQRMAQSLSFLMEGERRTTWRGLWGALIAGDWQVEPAIVKVLEQWIVQGFSSLSEGERWIIWKDLGNALKDKDPRVVRTAVKVSGKWVTQGFLSLVEEEWQVIWKDLGNALIAKDRQIKQAAVEILGEWAKQGFSSLSEGERQAIWEDLGKALKDEDWRVRGVAVRALGQWAAQGFSSLSEREWQAIWEDLGKALKDEHSCVRTDAVEVIGQWAVQGLSKLSEGKWQDLWDALREALKDKDYWVRRAAGKAIEEWMAQGGFSSLSKREWGAIWESLWEALKCNDHWVREAVGRAVGQWMVQGGFSSLTEVERQGIWKSLGEALKDKIFSISRAAIIAIGQWMARGSFLLKEERYAIWKVLGEALKDKDFLVREAAVKAIAQGKAQGFSFLSEEERWSIWKSLSKVFNYFYSWIRGTVLTAMVEGMVEGAASLSEGEWQFTWDILLEALKDKDYSIREDARKAVEQVTVQGLSSLMEAERQGIWKGLWRALKDEDSWVRTTAVVAIGQGMAQGFSFLSEKEWKSLWGLVKELDCSIARALGKSLAQEKLIEYLSCATLPEKFIQHLEIYPEIREMLSHRVDAFEEVPSSFQDYSLYLYEVERLLSILRNQFLQKETEELDSPYCQNSKNCFLSNPLVVNQNLLEQLFEINNLLLTQETPWYPKQMILPLFEQARWSVVVLESDYEKLSFDLLWDSPANSHLNQVLPALRRSLDSLVQSYWGPGSFQDYRLKVYTKHFVQQEPTQFIDSGPIIVQNIEDYLTYSEEPLRQFAETDKLFTIQQFMPKTYSNTLQAIRLRHRSLLMRDSLPEHQLDNRALFFKYTSLPAKMGVIVMDYCEEDMNLALPSQVLSGASTGIQGKPSFTSSTASSFTSAPSASTLASAFQLTGSEADGSKANKLKGSDLKASQEVHIIDVSRQGNNCGLFALALGVKLALKNQSSLKQNARLPAFLESIAEDVLEQETSKTAEAGRQLRIELGKALLGSESYRQRRYDPFVGACVRKFEKKSIPVDMHVFLDANKTYIDKLEQGWSRRYEGMEKAYGEQERVYRKLLGETKPEVIADLRERLSKLVLQSHPEKEVSELIDTYYKMDSVEYSTLITCRALLRAAWLGVKAGTPEQRNHLLDSIEQCWMDKLLGFLKNKELGQTEEKGIESLLILSLLENTQFDNTAKCLKICDKTEVLSMAAGLWIKYHLHDNWKKVYKEYCEMIQTKPEFLTADELGCLANYWKINLDISFPGSDKPPYKSYENDDPSLLKVTLCNPSQMHWQVLDLQLPKSTATVVPLISNSSPCFTFTKATEPVSIATITPLPLSGAPPVPETGTKEELILPASGAVNTRELFKAIKAGDVEKARANVKNLNLQDQTIQDPDLGETLAETLLNSAVTEGVRRAVEQAIAENLQGGEKVRLEVTSFSTQPLLSSEDWDENCDKESDKAWEETEKGSGQEVSPVVAFSSQVQQMVSQGGVVATEVSTSTIAQRKSSR